MTHTLLIADRAYSSWSLRGWLSFAAFGIPVTVETTRLYQPGFVADLARYAPARTVPAVRTPEGDVLTDSLAIAWHLADRFPDTGLLPSAPGARAEAQNLLAEMHSGFTALRGACPMNLRTGWKGLAPDDGVIADLARIEALWAAAMARHGGPWLCGAYCLADVFFAPVAARIAGYDLPVSDAAQAYVDRHLAEPHFRRWRAMGLVDGPDQDFYEMDLPRRPFPAPAPAPLKARAVGAGPSENASCPYSGRPVTDFLEVEGRIFGFCNPFCRDKTVADPEAWPAFMDIYRS